MLFLLQVYWCRLRTGSYKVMLRFATHQAVCDSRRGRLRTISRRQSYVIVTVID